MKNESIIKKRASVFLDWIDEPVEKDAIRELLGVMKNNPGILINTQFNGTILKQQVNLEFDTEVTAKQKQKISDFDILAWQFQRNIVYFDFDLDEFDIDKTATHWCRLEGIPFAIPLDKPTDIKDEIDNSVHRNIEGFLVNVYNLMPSHVGISILCPGSVNGKRGYYHFFFTFESNLQIKYLYNKRVFPFCPEFLKLIEYIDFLSSDKLAAVEWRTQISLGIEEKRTNKTLFQERRDLVVKIFQKDDFFSSYDVALYEKRSKATHIEKNELFDISLYKDEIQFYLLDIQHWLDYHPYPQLLTFYRKFLDVKNCLQHLKVQREELQLLLKVLDIWQKNTNPSKSKKIKKLISSLTTQFPILDEYFWPLELEDSAYIEWMAKWTSINKTNSIQTVNCTIPMTYAEWKTIQVALNSYRWELLKTNSPKSLEEYDQIFNRLVFLCSEVSIYKSIDWNNAFQLLKSFYSCEFEVLKNMESNRILFFIEAYKWMLFAVSKHSPN